MQEQRNTLDERMMAAVVSSIRAAEVIIAVVDSSECRDDTHTPTSWLPQLGIPSF
jgi:GTPase Era involved in 16S rRNA processing